MTAVSVLLIRLVAQYEKITTTGVKNVLQTWQILCVCALGLPRQFDCNSYCALLRWDNHERVYLCASCQHVGGLRTCSEYGRYGDFILLRSRWMDIRWIESAIADHPVHRPSPTIANYLYQVRQKVIPLKLFVVLSATAWNFSVKFYTFMWPSYPHLNTKRSLVLFKYDEVIDILARPCTLRFLHAEKRLHYCITCNSKMSLFRKKIWMPD